MNYRRAIGSILALALLAGGNLLPPTKAACAIPTAKADACPSCVPAPAAETAALSADRSCCAAPSSLTEREPARIAPDRSGDPRVFGLAVIVPAARVLIAVDTPRALPVEPPGASPPILRTTILLI